MKEGTRVSICIGDEWIDGTTTENAALSPIAKNPSRTVIRVTWDDGSQSIEDTSDLVDLDAA